MFLLHVLRGIGFGIEMVHPGILTMTNLPCSRQAGPDEPLQPGHLGSSVRDGLCLRQLVLVCPRVDRLAGFKLVALPFVRLRKGHERAPEIGDTEDGGRAGEGGWEGGWVVKVRRYHLDALGCKSLGRPGRWVAGQAADAPGWGGREKSVDDGAALVSCCADDHQQWFVLGC